MRQTQQQCVCWGGGGGGEDLGRVEAGQLRGKVRHGSEGGSLGRLLGCAPRPRRRRLLRPRPRAPAVPALLLPLRVHACGHVERGEREKVLCQSNVKRAPLVIRVRLTEPGSTAAGDQAAPVPMRNERIDWGIARTRLQGNRCALLSRYIRPVTDMHVQVHADGMCSGTCRAASRAAPASEAAARAWSCSSRALFTWDAAKLLDRCMYEGSFAGFNGSRSFQGRFGC